MFRAYVEPSLLQAQRLLMNAPASHADVYQCIGKLVAAIITAVGPELQMATPSVAGIRQTIELNCAIMSDHSDPLVQAGAISCLQQLHMFAPQFVDLAALVPTLCDVLASEHLFLRRAAVACLHQLSQREAKEVGDHAHNWIRRNAAGKVAQQTSITGDRCRKLAAQSDHGLVGLLFAMLDR